MKKTRTEVQGIEWWNWEKKKEEQVWERKNRVLWKFGGYMEKEEKEVGKR